MRFYPQVPDNAVSRACIAFPTDSGPCVDLEVDIDRVNWAHGSTIVIGERAVREAAKFFGLVDEVAVQEAQFRAAAALAEADGYRKRMEEAEAATRTMAKLLTNGDVFIEQTAPVVDEDVKPRARK